MYRLHMLYCSFCTYEKDWFKYVRKRVKPDEFDPVTEDPKITQEMLEDMVKLQDAAIRHRGRHEFPVPP